MKMQYHKYRLRTSEPVSAAKLNIFIFDEVFVAVWHVPVEATDWVEILIEEEIAVVQFFKVKIARSIVFIAVTLVVIDIEVVRCQRRLGV